jgi:glycosyltransferase involved in cell wall biosynthesis
MIRQPLVSVVIPTYNRDHTLRRAIDSVLNQTYMNFEVLVVDDGSIDNTHEVLHLYGDKIRWWSQKNDGPSSARNSGIREAKGEYVAFLDSDDAWAPRKLEKQIQALLRCPNNVVCCLCNTQFKGQNYKLKTAFEISKISPKHEESIWINVTEVLITRFVLFNQAAVVRRDVLNENMIFDEKLRIMEDYDFALRLSKIGPWALINEPLVNWYPDTPVSLSHSVDRIKVESLVSEILDSFARDLKPDSRLAALADLRRRAICRLKKIYKIQNYVKKKYPRLFSDLNLLIFIWDRLCIRFQKWPNVVTVPISIC